MKSASALMKHIKEGGDLDFMPCIPKRVDTRVFTGDHEGFPDGS